MRRLALAAMQPPPDRRARPSAGGRQMLRLALAIAGLALALPAAADDERVVADLSQNRVSITADFVGSEILVFGAVKREVAVNPIPLGVIVVVEGPSQPVVVRRKARVAGIWANTASVEIDRAPSFYAVATSAPLEEILTEVEDLRFKVTPGRAIRSVGAPQDVLDSPEFTTALIRIREADGLFKVEEGAVSFTEETLFSTAVELPANLVEGDYGVRILLTRERQVVTTFDTGIFVQKVGLERFLHNLAHDQPFIYGLLALALAAGAGWGASAAFRAIRT